MSSQKVFELVAPYKPGGDQVEAIAKLSEGVNLGDSAQTLLGVTGSGKTFTMANVIANTGRPTLILAHNKTLAAQLYGEMREFFPHNAVEYFVSYYDYYQPEAYVVSSDTYIEKDAMVNEHIEQMRLSATKALLERKDVVIVASVSAIYGLGSPETYLQMMLHLSVGEIIEQNEICARLADLQYERNDITFTRAQFRVRGDVIDVFPAESEDEAIRIELFGDEIEQLIVFDPLTGHVIRGIDRVTIYPKTHYVTPQGVINKAIEEIRDDLAVRRKELLAANRLVEEQRITERTTCDLEMLKELGYCSGIENYSRYLSNRKPGDPPPCLFDYLPKDGLLIIDESHATLPQLRAMYRGDRSRKETLVNFGFRLPSALDNRPLKFEEFVKLQPQTIYVSATPGDYELEVSSQIVEQVVRPTGLLDPEVEVRPVATQVDDVLSEIHKRVTLNERVLVTTLTKRMAEDLTEYLNEHGVRVRYLHSDVDTVERVEIIKDLRLGKFDVLVGINLLREGLDMPEVSLVAILDADKEGFLRSTRSLIQTIGRAARNLHGKAILYGDKITDSMKVALEENKRRRAKQLQYNAENGITPKSVVKKIADSLSSPEEQSSSVGGRRPKQKHNKSFDVEFNVLDTVGKYNLESSSHKLKPDQIQKQIAKLKKHMLKHAENLEFEQAVVLRNQIQELEKIMLELM